MVFKSLDRARHDIYVFRGSTSKMCFGVEVRLSRLSPIVLCMHITLIKPIAFFRRLQHRGERVSRVANQEDYATQREGRRQERSPYGTVRLFDYDVGRRFAGFLVHVPLPCPVEYQRPESL